MGTVIVTSPPVFTETNNHAIDIEQQMGYFEGRKSNSLDVTSIFITNPQQNVIVLYNLSYSTHIQTN